MALRPVAERPGRAFLPEAVPAERHHLRVVPPDYISARARRRRARRLVVLGGIGVTGALFGVVAFHVVLTQSQLNLQHLRSQAETASVRQQQLRLQVAQLESPERVVEDAQRLGMVPPASVRYLSPSPAGTPLPAPAARRTPTTIAPRTAAPKASTTKTPATTTPAKTVAKPVTTATPATAKPATSAPSPTTVPTRPTR
jgi:cell division protein FtsB